jgi:DNA/RNA-binding domain of Phe-tRNA-synthetase-like protein
MEIRISDEIRRRLAGLSLGVLEIHGVHVSEHNQALWQDITEVCREISTRMTLETLTRDPVVLAVREMYKMAGMDPTRYRPSAEALLHRVLQGKGLYQVNTVVDVNNLCSLESRLPCGVYDMAGIRGQVTLRVGQVGERYEGIGKSIIDAMGKIVLADEEKVFGSPTADSTATMITLQTRDVLMVIFAPPRLGDEYVAAICQRAAERHRNYSGGHVTNMVVTKAEDLV